MKRLPNREDLRPGDVLQSKHSAMRIRIAHVHRDGLITAVTAEEGRKLQGRFDPSAFELEGGKRGQMNLFGEPKK